MEGLYTILLGFAACLDATNRSQQPMETDMNKETEGQSEPKLVKTVCDNLEAALEGFQRWDVSLPKAIIIAAATLAIAIILS